MKKYLLPVIVFFINTSIFSQYEKYVIPPPYYIKTVKLDNGKNPKPSSVIQLGHSVYFSFDDLQADEKEYYYKIVRFDENWQPTSLNESEYIDGFASDIITDMEQSIGTLQSYTHYRLQLPNENTRILLSGNYILQVLDDNEKIVFSKAFILYRKDINVGMQVKWANDVRLKDRLQFIDFNLYKSGYRILNETESITVKIFQNNDIGFSLDFHQPTFYQGDKWIYHYPQQAVFEGINEFRRFETKDLRGYNYGISLKELNQLYDFYPYTANFRTRYDYYKDINGAYILNSVQSDESVDIEADYVNVHFSFGGVLDSGERIFVIGRFNDFNPTDEYELIYNETTRRYETVVLLKQGYYDYMYVTKNERGEIDVTAIEGSFARTENDYTIVVYYRPPGGRYTKVIGYGTANSDQIRN
jgi:hypothetical protein